MPYSLKMKVTLPSIPTLRTAGMTERIRQRFQHEAGTLLLDAIRSHLGTDIYHLTPAYAAKKPRLREFRRVSGKSAAQPLILGATMFNALTVIPDGDGFTVMVQDGEAVDDGFDYAEHWQGIVDYLGVGLNDVENDLDQIMLDIIFEEMAL